MRNTFKRVTAVLLCLLMAGASLAACGSQTDDQPSNDPSTTTTAASAETTAAPETEPPYVYPEVNYNGAEFAILNEADRYSMIYHLMPTDMNGEALNDVRYKINQQVSERYGITLKETQVAYSKMLETARQELMANNPTHEVFYLTGPHAGTLLNEGYLHNFYDVEGINMDADYWDQTMIENGTLEEKYLYYLSGNYHLQPFECTTVYFFNRDIMENLNLELPYNLVREGKWTLDKAYEYAAKAANLNGEVNYDYKEGGSSVYGIASIGNAVISMVMGGDAYLIVKDSEGNPVIGFDNEHYASVCEKVAGLTSAEGIFHLNDVAPIFSQSRSLFAAAELKVAANQLREMEAEFGLLPMPKYDEAQQNYISNLYWGANLLCIPTTCTDIDRAAIVMDTLYYEANEQVLPVYYEHVSYKGLRDEDSVDMLDIIAKGRYLDWGLCYDWVGTFKTPLASQLQKGNGNIAALVESSKKVVEAKIEATMAKFGK